MRDLKKSLKQNKVLNNLMKIRRYFKDPAFAEWVNAFDKPNAILYHHYGEKNPNSNFYYIKFDDPALGFFAYWKMSIIGIKYAEKYNLKPVINWTEKSPYYEPNFKGENSNPFLYYFEPIDDVNIIDVENSSSVVMGNISRDTIGSFKGKLAYDFSNQLDEYVRINNEYFKIKDKLQNELYTEIENLLGEKKTIGVHIRGVEWGIEGHPIPPSLKEYFTRIDGLVEEGYEQIFVATDSDDALEQCRKKYGSKIVTFEDTLRSKSGSKTLMLFDQTITRKYHHYKLGREVLRDMLALSKCDCLIAGFSNVALAACVYKISGNHKYDNIEIIRPNEICKKGISATLAVKKMKEGKF